MKDNELSANDVPSILRAVCRRLDLNGFDRLEPTLFQGLASLRHLRLDVNQLTAVPRAALAPLQRLEILSVSLRYQIFSMLILVLIVPTLRLKYRGSIFQITIILWHWLYWYEGHLSH